MMREQFESESSRIFEKFSITLHVQSSCSSVLHRDIKLQSKFKLYLLCYCVNHVLLSDIFLMLLLRTGYLNLLYHLVFITFQGNK